MVKLLLLTSVLILSQLTPGDRSTDGEKDKADAIVEAVDETIGNAANSNLIETKEFEFKGSMPDFAGPGDRDKYDLSDYGFRSVRYMASIRIDELLWPGKEGKRWAENKGSILIGIKKPYYRLYRFPYVKGKVDLQMAGSIFGMKNKGLISFSYDLRSKDASKRISTTISLDSFSYIITIPIGKK
jgi:hypothetical protein